MPMHAVLTLWVLWSAAVVVGALHVLRIFGRAVTLAHHPSVAILAPVKGHSPFLADFFRRLRAQDYPNARIIVIVESASDPAFAAATAAQEGLGLTMTLVVAGASVETGQKVWNLEAGLRHVHGDDDIVATVDADTLPAATWLRRLVAPIVAGRAEATSGYRWLVPQNGACGSLLLAAVDQAIATIPRWRHYNIAWGGSFAAHRATLERIDLPVWWAGAISDDAQLTRALWAKGLKVVCPPGLFVMTPATHSWRSALTFGRRQFMIIRFHFPKLWALAIALEILRLAIAAACINALVTVDAVAIALMLMALTLDQMKGLIRQRIERRIVAETDARGCVARQWATPLALFLAPLLHGVCVLAALWSRRIRWAGIDYHVQGPHSLRVMRRDVDADG
jgi:cellulose synthase/poly-beta-1,6-N-acetylglucosamine synthase-like glycosyltransferase